MLPPKKENRDTRSSALLLYSASFVLSAAGKHVGAAMTRPSPGRTYRLYDRRDLSRDLSIIPGPLILLPLPFGRIYCCLCIRFLCNAPPLLPLSHFIFSYNKKTAFLYVSPQSFLVSRWELFVSS